MPITTMRKLTGSYFQRGGIPRGWSLLFHLSHTRCYQKLTWRPKAKRLAINELKDIAREHFKDYNKNLDQDLFAELLELYNDNVPYSKQPDAFEKVRKHNYTKGDWHKFATYVYKTSPLLVKVNSLLS